MRIDSTGSSPALPEESAKIPEASPLQQQSPAKNDSSIAFSCTQSQQPITFGNESVKPNENDKGSLKDKIASAGEHLKYVPGLGQVLKGIGNSDAGIGNTIAGGLGGVGEVLKNNVKGAVEGGSLNPQQLLVNAYMANVENFDKPKK
ncbi:hypothetical protein ACFQDN_23340 [Pseudomonas asuensis]|uniref:Uncharacterized protein n=1 Tax=Pseudomonas asuensis TaxID=1825787 RepID=A0ABQ2H5C7_9PSED|nr:hypothetical protein [Pseudomonas asuensis]GGM33048.1 hypothetical protein GCM10009425_49400 [Pseudomonas asuensis]